MMVRLNFVDSLELELHLDQEAVEAQDDVRVHVAGVPRAVADAVLDRFDRGDAASFQLRPLCVGLGKACEIARLELDEEAKRVGALRDKLEQAIMSRLDHSKINGDVEHRLPNNCNISFEFVEGEGLMMAMSDLAVSSGSACTSASLEPSYVLKALGIGDDLAHSSIRFGLGRFTTEEEVDLAIEKVVSAVEKLRAMSPLYEMAQEGIDLSTVQWQVPHE